MQCVYVLKFDVYSFPALDIGKWMGCVLDVIRPCNVPKFDVCCFQSQIIFFVKESNKEEDDTFLQLDVKISKFEIPNFPILDSSSQKSKIVWRF